MDLAGKLQFRPGHPLPTIASSRPMALAEHLRGQRPDVAERWIPTVYSLCGSAHRLCARLAIDAARGSRTMPLPAERSRLLRDTLAEHLRRLWLDWPRALQGQSADSTHLAGLPGVLKALASEPASKPPDRLAHDVATLVFGQSSRLGAWQAAWRDGDDDVLLRLLQAADTLPAAALAQAWPHAARLALEALPGLPARLESADAAALWLQMDTDGFLAEPVWSHHPMETGCWVRTLDRPPRHALDRLLGRLAETAALIASIGTPDASDTPDPLEAGAWSPAPGQALAWCQMARGLLVHAVELDGQGDSARIGAYRLLAPTEWNFHPRGAAARALARLDAREDPSRACALIAAAFDPCVEYVVEWPQAQETIDA